MIAAYTLPGARGQQVVAEPVDDDSNAAVVNNGVISFAEGLSGINREYIRKSYLLASSYVSDVLNIQRGGQAWYDEFIKVMISLGWLPVRSRFERVSSTSKGLTVQLAALNIIATLWACSCAPSPRKSSSPACAVIWCLRCGTWRSPIAPCRPRSRASAGWFFR